MPSVLFVISIYNYHREVEPVVRRFVQEGWRTNVLIGWLGETADTAAAAYENLGCQVCHPPARHCYVSAQGKQKSNTGGGGTERNVPRGWGWAPDVVRPIARRVLSAFPPLFRLAALPGLIHLMRDARSVARDLLEEIRPDVVFQGPFHSIGKLDNAIYIEARNRNIPRCCYPVSAYHGRENVYKARYNNIRVGMTSPTLWCDFDILNRVMAWLAPGWTRSIDGRVFFMSDPISLMAASLAGNGLDDIWQKPQPDFDRVFVYSKYSASLLDDGTFPMERVEVCGIPLLDDVVGVASDDRKRAAVFRHVGLADQSPFLLFNVEPSLEHHYADSQTHWRNFRTMMECVCAFGLPVVLSLHPLCKLDDYVFAEIEYGVTISRNWKIHQLYPLCTLVVSFPCSTNVIAEIFSKPLTVYDFFGIAAEGSVREREFRLPKAKFGRNKDEVAKELAKVLESLPEKAPDGTIGTFKNASLSLVRSTSSLLQEWAA